MKSVLFVFIFISLVLMAGGTAMDQSALANNLAAWPSIVTSLVAGGFENPVHISHAGDGSGRLFVIEQRGRIQIIKDRTFQSTFLDISDRVRSPANGGGNEEGLLSVAFPPGFGTSKSHFYVYYTRLDGNNQVSRFFLSGDPQLADPLSEQVVLELTHPTYENHNGGQLAFGPEGYLYIATGDGGGGGDPDKNAQNPGSLLGKLLRIDVEWVNQPLRSAEFTVVLPFIPNRSTTPPSFQPYRIPPDNPFVGDPAYRGEIWAMGLRNPWRFSFDRLSGDLFIGDVGQSNWEEVDYQPATSPGGENYGWNIMEGLECYINLTCDSSGLTLPVFTYQTHVGGCSITGGYVYRGASFSGLQGIYFFGDYCSGRIWGMQNSGSTWTSQELLDSTHTISSFGEDEQGELYLVDRSSGNIYQIIEITPQ